MKLRIILKMLYYGFKSICHGIRITAKGQSENYAILQTAHRIEKGLCVRNPKRLWGYEKASLLVGLLKKEENKVDKDAKAVSVGKAVLSAFIRSKEECEDMDEIDKLKILKQSIEQADILLEDNVQFGGMKNICKKDILFGEKELIENLFKSRHSIRNFEDSKIDMNNLEKAIDLAMYAPSACNRQAVKVYVIDKEERIKVGESNEYYADKYLIICGCISAFAVYELNDWIVGASIFAGYLSLALHTYGIGSCIINKSTIVNGHYSKSIRKLCNIPENEQIILEMAIGNYREDITVAVSYRKEAKDVLHYNY